MRAPRDQAFPSRIQEKKTNIKEQQSRLGAFRIYVESKSLHITCTVSYFHGTEFEISVGFGQVCNAEDFVLGLAVKYATFEFFYSIVRKLFAI